VIKARFELKWLCARTAVILSPFCISPGHEGVLRLRHVADVRFWTQIRTQKRSDNGIDAGHVGDIASGASYTPLKITCPRRSSRARKAIWETPQSGLEITADMSAMHDGCTRTNLKRRVGDMGALIRRRMFCSSRWVIPGPAAGVTGWPAGQRAVGGSRSSGRCHYRVKNGWR
jgi:hypothetical protein